MKLIITAILFAASCLTLQAQSPAQLAQWLKRFPDADANKDGRLTVEEAKSFWQKMQSNRNSGRQRGAPATFKVDPGWDQDRFPEHAVRYRTPKEIQAINGKHGLLKVPKPENGVLPSIICLFFGGRDSARAKPI